MKNDKAVRQWHGPLPVGIYNPIRAFQTCSDSSKQFERVYKIRTTAAAMVLDSSLIHPDYRLNALYKKAEIAGYATVSVSNPSI
jgi:hypothetical protein